MNYGDLGKRFVAYLIDTLVLCVILAVIGTLMAFVYVLWPLLIFIPFVGWIYSTLMEGGGWHATLGKRAMGLYVADADGNGITYSAAILRSIGKILSSCICGIGYIMSFFNPQKQCLHDMIAKTYVLDGKAKDTSEYIPNEYTPKPNEYTPKPNEYTPKLIGISGPLSGMIYEVPQTGLIIGRDTISCQVVLPASQGNVSRIHCFVTYNPMSRMFVINDRNSSYGTFTSNGVRISYNKPVALSSGGRFYLATPDNSFEVR